MDRKLLGTVLEKFDGGPVGVDNLAAAIGEERDTIEDVLEPFLIQQGFLQRTARGRVATAHRLPPLRPRAAVRRGAGGADLLPRRMRPSLVANFRFPVRVYYEDTDAAGVVYYANYLTLPRARAHRVAAPRSGTRSRNSSASTASYSSCAASRSTTARRRGCRSRSTSRGGRSRRAREPRRPAGRAPRRRAPRRGARRARLRRRRAAGSPRRIPIPLTATASRDPRQVNVHTDLSFVVADPAGVGRRAGGDGAARVPVAVELVADLPQAVPAASAPRARPSDFEDEFWKGGDLAELYQRASQSRTGAGLEHIFTAGFREYAKHRKQGSASAVTLDAARRAMRAAYQREIDALDAKLSGLATVGSVSPYIGLFGTVWGIMNSFRGPRQRRPGHARAGRAGHRRGADRDGDRPVRGDPGGGRVQPLHARRRPPRDALRDLHRGVLEHPPAPGMT